MELLGMDDLSWVVVFVLPFSLAWIPWTLCVAVGAAVMALRKRLRLREAARSLMQYERAVLFAVLAGYVVSTGLGFIILSFGGLIGRSGTTGKEYIGYWDPADMLFWAAMWGSVPGALGMPLAYFACLQRIPKDKWPRALGLGAALTLAGGLLGALDSPPLAVVTGVMGFGIACWYVRRKMVLRAV